jgi:hypothetical protein
MSMYVASCGQQFFGLGSLLCSLLDTFWENKAGQHCRFQPSETE